MLSDYLSAGELAELTGCLENSHACMKRWLDRNGWPYVENIRGFPRVWRKYHDARMSGENPEASVRPRIEPNFDALRILDQHEQPVPRGTRSFPSVGARQATKELDALLAKHKRGKGKAGK